MILAPARSELCGWRFCGYIYVRGITPSDTDLSWIAHCPSCGSTVFFWVQCAVGICRKCVNCLFGDKDGVKVERGRDVSFYGEMKLWVSDDCHEISGCKNFRPIKD